VGLIVALFSKGLLLLWTRNESTAQGAASLLSVLAIGQVLMGIMLLPYALQLAHAWTRLGVYANIFAIIVLVPSLIWAASKYGASGASFVWVALYGGQMLGIIQLMHRRILIGEKKKWYIDDVGRPFLAALVVVGAGRLITSQPLPGLSVLVYLGFLLVIAIGIAAISAPSIRHMIFVEFISWRSAKSAT
jgi:hypothetical protein